jgi:hypothetical protein
MRDGKDCLNFGAARNKELSKFVIFNNNEAQVTVNNRVYKVLLVFQVIERTNGRGRRPLCIRPL